MVDRDGCDNGGAAGSGPCGGPDHCREFVEDLVEIARRYNRWSYGPDLMQRKRVSATLADRYVPEGHPARRLLGSLVGADAPLPVEGVSGFRPELIAGGQNEEAYRHIAGAAAAVLAGLAPLVELQNRVDRRQLESETSPQKRREREAELADNEAGRRAGEELANYLNERIDETVLRQRLLQLMCTGGAAAGGDAGA